MAPSYLSLNTPKPADLLSASHQIAPAKLRAKLNSPQAARTAAEEFESIFLNTMFSQMTPAAEGSGPFADGPAVGVWKSMLTQEHAKAVAKKGGIGIADHVYRSLLAQQEVGAR
jgi:Rod binding domain-containing protein